MTYIVPIMNGYPLQLSTLKLDVAGQDLTSYLLKLLSDSGNLLVGAGRKQLFSDTQTSAVYNILHFQCMCV